MKIYIFGKKGLGNQLEKLDFLIDELIRHGFEVILNDVLKGEVSVNGAVVFNSLVDFSDIRCVISVGGDGTLLDLITYTKGSDVPILAVNAGRLGFLATLQLSATDKIIKEVLKPKFEYDIRALVRFKSESDVFGEHCYALNEFAITKRDTSSMIVIHCYIDDEFLNSYWADGLIVSTPTGSTGYSLSAGGPLVMPQTGNFVIAPINPHSLTVRPVIVPDSSKIELKVEGRSKKVLLSLDHRSASVSIGHKFTLKKEGFQIKLIKTEGASYFNTLRHKLNWGLDSRN